MSSEPVVNEQQIRATFGAGPVARFFLYVACAASALIAAIGVADAGSSLLFDRPIGGMLEITELALVVLIFMAQPIIVLTNAHISLDLLASKSAGPFGLVQLALTTIAGLLCYGLIGYTAIDAFLSSLKVREVTPGLVSLPVYPVKFLILLSAALTCAVVIEYAVRQVLQRKRNTPNT